MFFISVLMFAASCTYEKAELPVKSTECDSVVSYSEDIAPLVTNYCINCHIAGGIGSGDFTDYNVLKQKADNGMLKFRIVDLKDMPQAGAPTITEEQRAMIHCWIKQGAPQN